MDQRSPARSLFRSKAWVSSWLETWGADPQVDLIDLGGKAEPLDMVYRISHTLKKIIPVTSLSIAGFGYASLVPPRAEYNQVEHFIDLAGGVDSFARLLRAHRWNQFVIADHFDQGAPPPMLVDLAACQGWRLVIAKQEPSYRINAIDFDTYLGSLSRSTQNRYFQGRKRLHKQGDITRQTTRDTAGFFSVLNGFHQQRWGAPCYSKRSIEFMEKLILRLPEEGGTAVMELLTVNGQAVSVLFDIIWQGTRYNLQSGYVEKMFPQVALGSVHLGYAIEEAIQCGLVYDMLAGNGKHGDYKAKIATHQGLMSTYILARGYLKYLYAGYGK